MTKGVKVLIKSPKHPILTIVNMVNNVISEAEGMEKKLRGMITPQPRYFPSPRIYIVNQIGQAFEMIRKNNTWQAQSGAISRILGLLMDWITENKTDVIMVTGIDKDVPESFKHELRYDRVI